MKLIIDHSLCDSNGLCVDKAPDLLVLNDAEELVLIREQLTAGDIERARQAVAVCPKAALRIQG